MRTISATVAAVPTPTAATVAATTAAACCMGGGAFRTAATYHKNARSTHPRRDNTPGHDRRYRYYRGQRPRDGDSNRDRHESGGDNGQSDDSQYLSPHGPAAPKPKEMPTAASADAGRVFREGAYLGIRRKRSALAAVAAVESGLVIRGAKRVAVLASSRGRGARLRLRPALLRGVLEDGYAGQERRAPVALERRVASVTRLRVGELYVVGKGSRALGNDRRQLRSRVRGVVFRRATAVRARDPDPPARRGRGPRAVQHLRERVVVHRGGVDRQSVDGGEKVPRRDLLGRIDPVGDREPRRDRQGQQEHPDDECERPHGADRPCFLKHARN